jgi:hypothetical protein
MVGAFPGFFFILRGFEFRIKSYHTVKTASKNVTAGECFGGQEDFGILGNLS